MSTEAKVAAATAIVRLPLIVEYGGRSEDLMLEATPSTAGAEAIGALAAEVGAPNSEPAVCARTGRVIGRDAAIDDAELIRGDRIVFGAETRPVTKGDMDAPWRLVVAGGPTAGQKFPLTIGTHSVGRAGAIELDDAALSAEHLVLRVEPDGVYVQDSGSTNGTAVDGVALADGAERRVERGTLIRAGRSLLSVEPTAADRAWLPRLPDGTLSFNRQPRVSPPFTPRQFTLEAPPAPAQRGRIPLAASLLPLLIGGVLFFVIQNPAMLAFAAFAPVMAVGSYLEDRRSGKGFYKRGLKQFRTRLVELQRELEAARADEAAARRAGAPALSDLVDWTRSRDPRMWERRPDDEDFLVLRLGSGSLPSSIIVDFAPGGEDEIRVDADRLMEWYDLVPETPVTARLPEIGVLSLAGPSARVHSCARALAIQIATLHSPAEVRICAALGEPTTAEWDWLKWLPHCRGADGPSIAVGRAGSHDLLDDLLRIQREGNASRALVFIVDETVELDRSAITPLLRRGRESGIYVIWLGSRRTTLPGETGGIAEFEAETARVRYTETAEADVTEDVTADGLAESLALEAALGLAPLEDVSAVAAAARIPARVNLLEILGVPEPDASWVAERWTRSSGLGATIGATGDGPFGLDLRREGPHGLIAGTTGAGKSELLQTLVASLALEHPPTRLTFLLVDYKGGAAFKDCTSLPHTVGFVTDLDEHLTQRALVSLEAELKRREAVLRQNGSKDLMDIERHDPDAAPPVLLIVIDEFATLVDDIPAFVDGVVDVAQRGRSLGVHLLLATQSPSGVVTKDIRANTNLKIALRVSGPAESQDVLDVADAAAIPRSRPGRAIARTGHGELTSFQTAFVGGITGTDRAGVEVTPFALTTQASASEPTAGARKDEMDLHRIVHVCLGAAKHLGLADPRRPWLDPPATEIALDSLEQPTLPGAAAIGLVDDPARQTQYPLVLDLAENGSVLVYGAARAGKTTLLRTLACALAAKSTVSELNIYGIDFAGHGLRPLEAFPHCGSIIAGDDGERIERLFGLLRRTIEERKEALATGHVFSVEELAHARGEPVPRLCILLDGYANFVSAFERVNYGRLVDGLTRLVADGRGAGVHFAITADRRAAVPGALASAVQAKLALRMPSEDDYASLGFDLRMTRGLKLAPGRGLTGPGLEFQTAIAAGDASVQAQDAAVEALTERLNEKAGDQRAPAIRQLPVTVKRPELPKPTSPLTAVIGIADSSLEPHTVDLTQRHFLVAGPYRSGRSTALGSVAASLRASDPAVELHLLAPRVSPLSTLDIWTSATTGHDECIARATELQAFIAQRDRNDAPMVIVLDDGDELTDGPAGSALEAIIRLGRDRNVRVIAAAERAGARSFSGWPREIRRDEHGLLLQPDDTDAGTLNTPLPSTRGARFPLGRGYAVSAGAVELVQVAG